MPEFAQASIADWIAAIAAVVSALLTGLIAVLVQNFSRQQARLDIERQATSASQEVNVEVLKNQEMADFFAKSYFPGRSPEFVRRLYYTFWALNILWDVHQARKSGLISKRYYRMRFGGGAARLVRRNPDCIALIISSNDQFDPAFLQEIVRWSPEFDASRFSVVAEADDRGV